jgi:ammonium transporter Rh
MRRAIADPIFYGLLLASQVAAVVFYGLCHITVLSNVNLPEENIYINSGMYPVFQDIHVMVFIGMAFLLAFLRRYRFSSVTEVFWLGAISVQYYYLWKGMIYGTADFDRHFLIDNSELIKAEYCAMAMVVALGAIMGKSNNLQILIAGIFGTLLFCVNEQTVLNAVEAKDVGGSMYIFCFGGWYGIGMTWILNYKNLRESINLVTDIDSNSFALIGSLFLWCFFPSFNSALAEDELYANIAFSNAYFCLIGSLIGAIMASRYILGGKLRMEHILNASIVGGVLMGSGADILKHGFVAYIIGVLGGLYSVLSMIYVKKIELKLSLFDVACVSSTFAIPGLFGGLLSAIYRKAYLNNGGSQIAGAFTSLAIGLGGGIVVGLLIRWLGDHQSPDDYYNDEVNVHYDDEKDYLKNPVQFKMKHVPFLFSSNDYQQVDQIPTTHEIEADVPIEVIDPKSRRINNDEPDLFNIIKSKLSARINE